MIRLYVLGRPLPPSPIAYRGIDRPGPLPVTDREHYPEAAAAFEQFVTSINEDQSVPDEATAVNLIRAYETLHPPANLELIEISDDPGDDMRGSLLGIDVAAGTFSLLAWGLDLGRAPRSPIPQEDAYNALRPILRVVGNHYRDRLNGYGLFGEASDANSFLEVVESTHSIRPGIWEEEPASFVPLQIAVVDPGSSS